VHRIQPYELTRDSSLPRANFGFDSINVDLIYGLPHQTADTFAHTVEQIIGLAPDRIALFSYAHVPWLKKQQGSFAAHLPEGMQKFEIFRTGLLKFLEAAISTSAWTTLRSPATSLPFRSRTAPCTAIFQGYTTKAGADLYGMGITPSAAFKTPTPKTIATSRPGKRLSPSAASPPCAAISFPMKIAFAAPSSAACCVTPS